MMTSGLSALCCLKTPTGRYNALLHTGSLRTLSIDVQEVSSWLQFILIVLNLRLLSYIDCLWRCGGLFLVKSLMPVDFSSCDLRPITVSCRCIHGVHRCFPPVWHRSLVLVFFGGGSQPVWFCDCAMCNWSVSVRRMLAPPAYRCFTQKLKASEAFIPHPPSSCLLLLYRLDLI